MANDLDGGPTSMVANVMITAHDTTPTVSNLVRPIGNLGSALRTCNIHDNFEAVL
jgi:hypothetical protein